MQLQIQYISLFMYHFTQVSVSTLQELAIYGKCLSCWCKHSSLDVHQVIVALPTSSLKYIVTEEYTSDEYRFSDGMKRKLSLVIQFLHAALQFAVALEIR